MLKLFCVKDVGRKRVGSYFESKEACKKERDKMNEAKGSIYYHCAMGPDHMGPHGHTSPPMMRRQPRGHNNG